MVTPIVNRITLSNGTSSNRVMVTRSMGKVGGKVMPIRVYPRKTSGELLNNYQGNIIAHLSGIYGTGFSSWTTVDNRYTFTKTSESQNLYWEGNKWVLTGRNEGLYADVLSDDRGMTEMTIEVVMGNYKATSENHGIVLALNSGASHNESMYGNCKGLRSAGGGLIASYYGLLQDKPSPDINGFTGVKTIAFTNGSSTNSRVSYIIDGILTPSQNSLTPYTWPKTPTKFVVGGSGYDDGWNFGLKADIYAVRFHYGITPVEQLMANHLLDKKVYGF